MAGNAGKFQYVLMVWLLATAGPALAQDAILTYPQSYFASAQLATAYDMVGRLPGFVFNDGNGARGYSGTAGNVLIDGARPTAKTDDLQTILQRIPVSRVDHVDVIRGGAPGIDMQGQPVVANVILKQEDSSNIILILQNLFYSSGHDVPYGSVEFTARNGAASYDFTFTRYGGLADDSIGDGNVAFITPGQATIVTGARRVGPDQLGWALNGSASRPLLGGTFGANFLARTSVHNETVIYDPPEQMESLDSEKSRGAELGLHWDGNFGPAPVNLVGLVRLNRSVSFQTSSSPGSFTQFDSVQDTPEFILRAAARYPVSGDLALETGIDAAYNGLTGLSTESVNGVPQTIIGALASVHESRGEAFVQASWAMAPGWMLDMALHGEYSVIAASATPAHSFAFLKPRLLLSWQPLDNQQFRLRIERVIGQLDFSNFIATANLLSTGVAAGNVGLRPDQHWQIEEDYEFHFGDKGALTFSAMHDDITDLVDYVPLGNGQDGPGNVPKAVNNQYDLEYLLPLDKVGLEGGQFKGSLKWYDSALKDPVTGQTRSISNQRDRNLTLTYLQDLTSLHSTFELDVTPGGALQPTYRIAQISTFHLKDSYLSISWDYKPAADLDLLFQASNLVPYDFELVNRNYSGPRNTNSLSQIQDQRITTLPRFLLQLRKTF